MRRLPPAALIAACALAALETAYVALTFGFTGLPLFEPTVDDAVVAARLMAIEERIDGHDVVIVGDSSALRGLVPAALGEGGPERFYNLGTFVSFSLAGQLELAAAAVRSHASIDTVVVSLLPLSLGLDAHQTREFGLLGRFLVSHPSALEVYDVSLGERIDWFHKKHRVNRIPAHMGGSFERLYADLSATDGFLPKRRRPLDGSRRFGPVEPSELAMRSLEAFTDIARVHGVRVILSLNPRPGSAVTDDYAESTRELTRSVAARIPDLETDPAGSPVWNDMWFSDASHLDERGARRNSERLLERHFR